MITIQNADAALKDYYLEAFTAQLNDDISPFFSAIEKNTDNVYGKDVKLAVVRGDAGGIVAGSEDGDLPGPHKNRYLNITAPLKNIYGTIEISDKAMRASRESVGAFVNLVNAEMEGLVASARENFARMLFGDGTAKLCKITQKISAYEYRVDYVKPYFVGIQVDVYKNNNLVSNGYGLEITGIDMVENSIKLNKDLGENWQNSAVYVHDSKDNEITGLDALFSKSDLYGVSKTDEPYLIPQTFDSEGLSLSALCNVIDYMEENYNSKINLILCSYKTRKKIASLDEVNRRVINTIDSHTGYGNVTINNIPVYADKHCPEGKIYFLNTDDFALYQLCDWEWLEDEDGKILKQVPGKAAYTATLVKYAELVCRKPCGQAIFTDFTID